MSFLQQVQVQLNRLPVVMICLSDGTVVFVRLPGLPVYTLPEGESVASFILNDCISLWKSSGDEREPIEYEYQKVYNYKQHPLLLQWLQELNLQNPFT